MARFKFVLVAIMAALLLSTALAPAAGSSEYADTGDYGPWMLDERANVPGFTNDKELGRALVIDGNRVYIGGMFEDVKANFGDAGTSMPWLVAFDRASGTPITSFTPDVNGPIYDMVMSPDGQRLYIAGGFTSVDGNTNARGIAAVNPTTGRLITGFQARVTYTGTTDPMSVRTLHIVGNDLFVGGDFNHIEQANGSDPYRLRAARLDLTTGNVEGWTPSAQGGRVNEISSSPDGQRIYLAGMFTAINAQSQTGQFAAVDPNVGNLISGFRQGRRPSSNSYNTDRYRHGGESVIDTGTHIMIVGDQNIAVKDQAGDHIRSWELDGDPQVAMVHDGHIYVGGHYTVRITPGSIEANMIVRFNASDMTLDETYQAEIHGDSGVWDFAFEADGTMWITGGLAWAGNRRIDGLARYTPTQGPVGGGPFACQVTDNGNGSATVTWTDNGGSGWDVSHDGGGAAWRTTNSFTDFTPGTNYTVTSWGNGTNGTSATCTNPGGGGGGFSCSVTANANGSATVTWNNIGANGYDVSHDGGGAAWRTTTSFTDTTPGTNYTVTAWGNGTNGTSATCTNPGGGGGGFNCSVNNNGNGSVTISWSNIGANGYDLVGAGAAAVWVTGTSFTDTTPNASYQVVAWGNGTNGTTATC